MPQETKSKAQTGQSIASDQSHEHDLQGWIPQLASEDAVREALEHAFDYRGDITLTLRDGSVLEGYVFDRDTSGSTLADCRVRMFPKDRDEKVSLSFADIARIEFTGKDTAAGKSFETYMKKFWERLVAEAKSGASGSSADGD